MSDVQDRDGVVGSPPPNASGVTRRRMLGYLLAAPTLTAAARWGAADEAVAAVPSAGPTDLADLSDILTYAATPTMSLLKISVGKDGRAHFELPRAEVGQGITTACAMVIADELDMPIDKVVVTLADAKPELLYNQLTGGSNTMHAIYMPLRSAAAAARGQLQAVAADRLSVPAALLRSDNGTFVTPDGRSVDYGALAEAAAVRKTRAVTPKLRQASSQKLVGRDQKRLDALAIVTGKKRFATDLDVKDALPTMVCRPPQLNGNARSVRNAAEVRRMPGVTDVLIIPHNQYVAGGVAVRARTFGQCIDAIRALDVVWDNGTAQGFTNDSVLKELKNSEIPLTPALPGTVTEEVFTFNFRSGDALEPNTAIADVRKDRAEIWSCLKSPIWAKQQIALALGLPQEKVVVHVTEGGGSFGRHLFCDAAFEAASISQKMGKPVRLMWHRSDGPRQGRTHPMAISRVRTVHQGKNIVAVDQRHTAVACDFTQGLGELLTSLDTSLPGQNFTQFSETVFTFTANVPYQFGAVSQLLNEVYQIQKFNTSSVRNVYSPDVSTAIELMVDRVANQTGQDRMQMRLDNAKDDRMKAVIRKAAEAGQWGRSMEPGTAQGFAVRSEYKGRSACLVEIDCRPETVSRKVKGGGYTGPKVTKVVFAVDVGLPINPLGIRAQIMGGAMDGIAQALTFSLHMENGRFLEGSWSQAHYTRQWNAPSVVDVIVMPQTTDTPGGAGEFGVGTTMAAVACAYYKATGKFPTEFPINHREPLNFTPFPAVPPIPQSPTDGLKLAGYKRPKVKKKSTKKKSTVKKAS